MMIRSTPNDDFLDSASAVIDALGGTAKAALLATEALPDDETCSQQSVSNWRAAGRLPSYTFLIFTEALAAIGKRASPTLWGIAPTRQRQSATL